MDEMTEKQEEATRIIEAIGTTRIINDKATEILKKVCNYRDNDTMELNDDITVEEALKATKEYTIFKIKELNEWLEDNHTSFTIPDMIIQDFIKYNL